MHKADPGSLTSHRVGEDPASESILTEAEVTPNPKEGPREVSEETTKEGGPKATSDVVVGNSRDTGQGLQLSENHLPAGIVTKRDTCPLSVALNPDKPGLKAETGHRAETDSKEETDPPAMRGPDLDTGQDQINLPDLLPDPAVGTGSQTPELREKETAHHQTMSSLHSLTTMPFLASLTLWKS